MAEEETIVQKRKALMVPATGGDVNPFFRTAHFLKPPFRGGTGSGSGKPPLLPPSSFRHPSGFDSSKLPLKISFCSWKSPSREWKIWAAQMELKYGAIWEKGGILKAIRASRFETLTKDDDLLLTLVQRWSPATSSFVFPWGEATITLEDVMVAGAYSVLGSPVSAPLETKEMKCAAFELEKEWSVLCRSCHNKVRPCHWVDRFMEKDTAVEHEAFLVLWLSQFVFPESKSVLRKTFSLAVVLSRGTRVALAPAVLGTIYRDLNIMKRGIDEALGCSRNNGNDCGNDVVTINIRSSFQLVQFWLWERFPALRPNPAPLRNGDLRIQRWMRRKPRKISKFGTVLDSGVDTFRWRPYAHPMENPMPCSFYPVNEMWVDIGNDIDDELLSFARFLFPCALVGLDDCVGQYLPHRVAMQFGMDQDLCFPVAQSSLDPKIAMAAFAGMKVYIPPRASVTGRTACYSEWWEESKRESKAQRDIPNSGKFVTLVGSKASVNNAVQEKIGGIDLSVPPGFKRMKETSSSVPPGFEQKHSEDVPPGFGRMKETSLSVPPGFEPKDTEDVPLCFRRVSKHTEDVPPGFEAKHPERRNPVVLMDVEHTKTKETNSAVRPGSVLKQIRDVPPGFEAKLSQSKNVPPDIKVECFDLDESSDLNHSSSDRLLKRPKKGSVGKSAPADLGCNGDSSNSDNSPFGMENLHIENFQCMVENGADTEQLERTEDRVGYSSGSGSGMTDPGENSWNIIVENLRNRISKAEELMAQCIARRRAVKG